MPRGELAFAPAFGFGGLLFGFDRGGFLDDVREHLPGGAALGRAVGFPDGGVFFREDVREIAVGFDAFVEAFAEVDVTGPLVFMFDEQPGAGLCFGGTPFAR